MRKTLRKRWRYIFFVVHLGHFGQGQSISKKTLERYLGEKLLRFFGELNFGDVAYRLIEYNERKNSGIIKIDRTYKDSALGCIALISEINRIPAHIEVVGVSGTLDAGREKFGTINN